MSRPKQAHNCVLGEDAPSAACAPQLNHRQQRFSRDLAREILNRSARAAPWLGPPCRQERFDQPGQPTVATNTAAENRAHRRRPWHNVAGEVDTDRAPQVLRSWPQNPPRRGDKQGRRSFRRIIRELPITVGPNHLHPHSRRADQPPLPLQLRKFAPPFRSEVVSSSIWSRDATTPRHCNCGGPGYSRTSIFRSRRG